MGSSEFEFNALPTSLRAIRNCIDNYVAEKIKIKNKDIFVFYNQNIFDIQTIKDKLFDLEQNNIWLQEYSDFDCYINDKSYYTKTTFWWDISNHLMFWTDNDQNNAIIELIKGEKQSKLEGLKKLFHKHKFEIRSEIATGDVYAEKFNQVLQICECFCGKRINIKVKK